MNACKLVEHALKLTQQMINRSVADLTDADLLVHPTDGANHIAWQLGHLIASEQRLGRYLTGAKFPELPAGFAEKHGNNPNAQNATGGFGTKAEYLELFNKTREATLAAVSQLTEADFDKEASGPANINTLGGILNLVSAHTMMHGGQFSVVRRKLGKPVLM